MFFVSPLSYSQTSCINHKWHFLVEEEIMKDWGNVVKAKQTFPNVHHLEISRENWILICFHLIVVKIPRKFIQHTLTVFDTAAISILCLCCRVHSLVCMRASNNSRKSVRWSAVPVAPLWVSVCVRWLEGQRPRRGRWPMLVLTELQGWN